MRSISQKLSDAGFTPASDLYGDKLLAFDVYRNLRSLRHYPKARGGFIVYRTPVGSYTSALHALVQDAPITEVIECPHDWVRDYILVNFCADFGYEINSHMNNDWFTITRKGAHGRVWHTACLNGHRVVVDYEVHTARCYHLVRRYGGKTITYRIKSHIPQHPYNLEAV